MGVAIQEKMSKRNIHRIDRFRCHQASQPESSANVTDLKHVLLKPTAMTTESQSEFSIGLNGCEWHGVAHELSRIHRGRMKRLVKPSIREPIPSAARKWKGKWNHPGREIQGQGTEVSKKIWTNCNWLTTYITMIERKGVLNGFWKGCGAKIMKLGCDLLGVS